MEVKTKAPTEQALLFGDLDKPSLHALSYALRHPDTWPEGFVWKYSNCDQCAMGLAHRLWMNKVPSVDPRSGPSVMARAFAMPYEKAEDIFMGGGYTEPKFFGWVQSQIPMKHITPEMVADQIDAYLATAE